MSVAETSIEAYHDHRDNGRLGSQALWILDHMQPGRNYSRRELVEATGIELSSVCGRVNELVKAGLLVEGDKRACAKTGRTIIPVAKAATLFTKETP